MASFTDVYAEYQVQWPNVVDDAMLSLVSAVDFSGWPFSSSGPVLDYVIQRGGLAGHYDPSYAIPLAAASAPGVFHTVTMADTPTSVAYTMDGTPANVTPLDLANYTTHRGAQTVAAVFFGLAIATPGFPTRTIQFGTIKIGTTPGGNDLFDFDPTVDPIGAFSNVVGNCAIVGGMLQIGPQTGAPGDPMFVEVEWPDLEWRFPVLFSVGSTRVAVDGPTAPPDATTRAFGVLPDLPLGEGCRLEFGTYTPTGGQRAVDGTVDAVLTIEDYDVDYELPGEL